MDIPVRILHIQQVVSDLLSFRRRYLGGSYVHAPRRFNTVVRFAAVASPV